MLAGSPHTAMLALEIAETITDIPAASWDALAGGHPLLSHAFLDGLHRTGCAAPTSGWAPHYLLLRRGSELTGAMPLYLKNHSYGEYVFDWAWADAYERVGRRYYPKLLGAIPFSPVTGTRLLVSDGVHRAPLIRAALALAHESGVSSLHILFPDDAEAAQLEQAGLLIRHGVQFHWHNAGYASFDEFLAGMNHDKRKKIRQERRKVSEAGVSFRRLTGAEIRQTDWNFFYRCYAATYRAHLSTPYLNRAFFHHLGETMAEQVLLVIAERDGKPVASALNLFGAGVLYGRYWGAMQFISALHFETCYYQAIEFCIERGIERFEGGAQGEHKLARGFSPVRTQSAHWLAEPQFASAIERYLQRESSGMEAYIDELSERQPFKQT
jgi:predicted N-acyltransferase